MKRKLEDNELNEDGSENEELMLDEETIGRLLDSAPEIDVLDIVGLKRMLVSFDRSITKNNQMRIKYPGQPNKIVDSEVDLDEEIKKLHALATAPHLYKDFIELKAHESVMGLLIHENTDITCDAIELLKELTESDENSPDSIDSVKLLVDTMISNQILELLASNLNRLKEGDPEEKLGVYGVLGIFENFMEVDSNVSTLLGAKTELLAWLLKRIQVKEFDEIKQYASETLSILLQNSLENQKKIGKSNGIEVMLTVIAKYKKNNPATSEEEEFVENIFNCLCICIADEENKKFFTNAEGLKLTQIMIKNKTFTRKCSLKLLDHILQRDVANCRRFINLPGLGTLFTSFMKVAKKKRKGFDEMQDDEHLCSIIASLFKMLHNVDQGKLWARVLNKFREENLEKVERLMELYEKYLLKYKKSKAHIEDERQRLLDEGEEIDSEEEENFFLEKLDAGFATLQHIVFLIATISQADAEIKEKVSQLLTLQGSTFDEVKTLLLEYAEDLGDQAITDEKDKNNGINKTMLFGLANDLCGFQGPVYQ
jgi:beta-catenin-like protein 1